MKKEKKDIKYINNGTDEQMEICGYQKSIIGLIITWIFIVLTIGFLKLVFYWKPNWMLLCTHRECSLKSATSVLLRVSSSLKKKMNDIKNFKWFSSLFIILKDKYQQWFVEKVDVLKKTPSIM